MGKTQITIVKAQEGGLNILAATARGWRMNIDAEEMGLTEHIDAVVTAVEELDNTEGARAEKRLAEKQAEINEKESVIVEKESVIAEKESVIVEKERQVVQTKGLFDGALTLVMQGTVADQDLIPFKEFFPQYSDLIGQTRPKFFPFTHEGRLYRTAQEVTFVEQYVPGQTGMESQFYEITDPDEVADWVQPMGHNPYLKGDRVRYEGVIWIVEAEQSVYPPGVVDGEWRVDEE